MIRTLFKIVIWTVIPLLVSASFAQTFETILTQDTSPQEIYNLIKAGADPNERLTNGDTVLIAAAAMCPPETVQALVEAGADVNQQGYNGGRTALMDAVAYSGSETVRILLQAGAKPDITDMYKRTALMIAAAHNDIASMRLLLQAGAEVNAADGDIGMTPLMYAAWEGTEESIQMLLDAGADASIMTYNRWYAYDYAGFNDQLIRSDILEELYNAIPQ